MITYHKLGRRDRRSAKNYCRREIRVEPLEARQMLSVTPPGVDDFHEAGALLDPVGVILEARDDHYEVVQNTTLEIGLFRGVLRNDTPGIGIQLFPPGGEDGPSHWRPNVVLVEGAINGTLDLHADGSFVYTPNDNFIGEDTFTYQFTLGDKTSNVATVTIDVQDPASVVLEARDDWYFLRPDQTVLEVSAERGVLKNDTRGATAVLVEGPAFGELTLNEDGSFRYVPNDSFTGDDSFTYKTTNGTAESNVATVTLHRLTPPTVVLEARDDHYEVLQNTTLEVGVFRGVLRNDGVEIQSPGGDNPHLGLAENIDGPHDGEHPFPALVTAVLVEGPANGVLELRPDGSFIYTPNDNFLGQDSFTYQMKLGDNLSNAATVTIGVKDPADMELEARDDVYFLKPTQSVLEVSAERGVLRNDTRGVTAVLVAGPAFGTLTLNENGSFRYARGEGFTGDDSFTYKTTNGAAESNVATVKIHRLDVPPPPTVLLVANNDRYVTAQNTTLEVGVFRGVLRNDGPELEWGDRGPGGDEGGPSVTPPGTTRNSSGSPGPGGETSGEDLNHRLPVVVTLVEGSANGTVDLHEDGSFVFTPNEGFLGAATFTYRFAIGTDVSNVATVTIEVKDPATIELEARNDWYSLPAELTQLDIPAERGVLANDSGGGITAIPVDAPLHGTVTLSPDGSFTYAPDDTFEGEDKFTYKTTNGVVESNVATVFIKRRAWHNEDVPTDIDGDGSTFPVDVLRLKDSLNRRGIRVLPNIASESPDAMFDVNGDGICSPADLLPVLDMVNRLNRQTRTAMAAATDSAIVESTTSSASHDIAVGLAINAFAEDVATAQQLGPGRSRRR